jgi:hypothetical protein
LLRIEIERDRKLIELSKKEEASMLKKEGEIYRLKYEMIAKSKVTSQHLSKVNLSQHSSAYVTS